MGVGLSRGSGTGYLLAGSFRAPAAGAAVQVAQGSGCSGPPGTAPSPSPSPSGPVSPLPQPREADSEPGCVMDLLAVTWVPLFTPSLWGPRAFPAAQPWNPSCHIASHVHSHLLEGPRLTGV